MATSSNALAERLYGVLARMLRSVRNSGPSNDLTLERLNALRLIDSLGPVTVAHLAQLEGVHASTMSRMISSLAKEGLVRRVPHQGDGRGSLVKLTSRGQSTQQQALRRRLLELIGRLDQLSAKERATLEQALKILEKSILPGLSGHL